jgi:hypothetical protein
MEFSQVFQLSLECSTLENQVGLGNFQGVEDDVEPCICSSEKQSSHLLELNHHNDQHDDCEEKIKSSDNISKA